MLALAPDYLAEIARQIGFISAFLGGVAATFMIQLVSLSTPGRQRGWAILCAAAASVAFITAVVATTMLVMALHPHAPAANRTEGNIDTGRVLAFLSFGIGIYLLLACIGLSGWLRSRRTGQLTTGVAAIGAALITLAIVD